MRCWTSFSILIHWSAGHSSFIDCHSFSVEYVCILFIETEQEEEMEMYQTYLSYLDHVQCMCGKWKQYALHVFNRWTTQSQWTLKKKKKTCAYVRPEVLILRKDTAKLSSQTSSGFTAKHFPPNYFQPVSFLKRRKRWKLWAWFSSDKNRKLLKACKQWHGYCSIVAVY